MRHYTTANRPILEAFLAEIDAWVTEGRLVWATEQEAWERHAGL